jgi:hypothetical protein
VRPPNPYYASDYELINAIRAVLKKDPIPGAGGREKVLRMTRVSPPPPVLASATVARDHTTDQLLLPVEFRAVMWRVRLEKSGRRPSDVRRRLFPPGGTFL